MATGDDETLTGDASKEAKSVPKKAARKKVVQKKKSPKKKGAKKPAKSVTPEDEKQRAKRIERPFPRVPLQDAIKVPNAIKVKNGGNPWTPDQVADAVGYGAKANTFFYLTTASRDFGLTEGSRDSAEISLAPLGRQLVYAENAEREADLCRQAFLRIPVFQQVLDYYKGNILPEMNYLSNVLESKFQLEPAIHHEFAELFRKNCEFVGIREGIPLDAAAAKSARISGKSLETPTASGPDFVTVAEPEDDTGLICFVAMPFTERHADHVDGFFTEVLNRIIAPAGRQAGFKVVTARKQGSDVIQSTIVNGLLDADLVVVDLTEHNPNVLFELGMRLAEDKPVALIRAKGTPNIFDVDIMRVEDYSPSLWYSTVEIDMPKIADHIKATWEGRDSNPTYMQLLRKAAAKRPPMPQA
jgi:hypothetical protein